MSAFVIKKEHRNKYETLTQWWSFDHWSDYREDATVYPSRLNAEMAIIGYDLQWCKIVHW